MLIELAGTYPVIAEKKNKGVHTYHFCGHGGALVWPSKDRRLFQPVAQYWQALRSTNAIAPQQRAAAKSVFLSTNARRC
jgi:hypothetical protein